MGVISPFDDNTVTEPRKERRPFHYWRFRWSFVFHRCMDTKKIIWPLTKAYRNTHLMLTERVTISEPKVTRWITPQAHMFRKLKRKSE